MLGVSRDPLHGAVDFLSKLKPQALAPRLVPDASLSVFVGSQPMKANLGSRHVGSLLFFSERGPWHCRRRIVADFFKSTLQLDLEIVVAEFGVFGRQCFEQSRGDDPSILGG